MFIHVFLGVICIRRQPSAIGIIVQRSKAFGENDQLGSWNLIFLNRFLDKRLRNTLSSAHIVKVDGIRSSKYLQCPKFGFLHPTQLSIKAMIYLHSKPTSPKHRTHRTYIQELNQPLSFARTILTLETFKPLFPKRVYFIFGVSDISIRHWTIYRKCRINILGKERARWQLWG
jgi:hypothetical protein